MKKAIPVLAILLLFTGTMLRSQERYPRGQDTAMKLTHHMSPEEAKLKHLIGKDFTPTSPPTGPVRNVAEFEPMQGVLIRYQDQFEISYDLIREMAEDINIVTIVEDQNEENTVIGYYTTHNVNLNNCTFLHAGTDSHWTRDYGPWFIFDGNDEPAIVDFPYNRPRPLDDEIPVEVSQMLGIDLYGMDVVHTGGNYMTDGYGISASTDIVWSENGSLSHAEIDQMMLDYLGISNYHVLPDPNNTYIDHIDCWGKFLDVDKVLIREVPSSHPQYSEIEATAAYFASQTSGYGVPYEVYRVYTPDDQPYTNSLILNQKVLVPITGSQWDDEALQTYEDAMPGYEAIGFTGSWASTDALHCRTKGIADIEMLHIDHMPLLGDVGSQSNHIFEATITPHSGQPLYLDSIFVIYSINYAAWDTLLMANTSGKTYQASISSQSAGSMVRYYLSASDHSGRNATHPVIGKPDPHVFTVGTPVYPAIASNPVSLSTDLASGGTTVVNLDIDNTGGMNLIFDASVNYSGGSNYIIQVAPQSSDYWTGSTSASAKTEVSLVKGHPPTEAGWMKFDVSSIPDGANINSIEFNGFVNDTHWPYWNINPVSNDPHITSAFALYNDINAEENSGYYLRREENSGFSSGWKNYTLGGNANTDLEAALPQDWFTIGIMDRDDDTYYIDFDGWQEANAPYLEVDYDYTPSYSWLSLDGGNVTSGVVPQSQSVTISVGFDASGLSVGTYQADILINSNDPGSPQITVPVTLNVVPGISLDLTVLMEGPFDGAEMTTHLNPGEIPLDQPYNSSPWNYPGTESVASMPNPEVVDWLLVELRDAPDAASATSATIAGQQAAFLLRNGSVVALDGSAVLNFSFTPVDQLFAVVWHRNHLGIMSASPLTATGGVYSYDFTAGVNQVFGGPVAHKELSPGVWGMIAGDGNADGQIDNTDKNIIWAPQAGQSGYHSADFNLDGQVNNNDKNDLWIPNSGSGGQVPASPDGDSGKHASPGGDSGKHASPDGDSGKHASPDGDSGKHASPGDMFSNPASSDSLPGKYGQGKNMKASILQSCVPK